MPGLFSQFVDEISAILAVETQFRGGLTPRESMGLFNRHKYVESGRGMWSMYDDKVRIERETPGSGDGQRRNGDIYRIYRHDGEKFEFRDAADSFEKAFKKAKTYRKR